MAIMELIFLDFCFTQAHNSTAWQCSSSGGTISPEPALNCGKTKGQDQKQVMARPGALNSREEEPVPNTYPQPTLR